MLKYKYIYTYIKLLSNIVMLLEFAGLQWLTEDRLRNTHLDLLYRQK